MNCEDEKINEGILLNATGAYEPNIDLPECSQKIGI